METDTNRKKRVLCPVTHKDGKTHWMKLGTAFVNRDNSINVYLDVLPTNGKLQVRDWDDLPWDKRGEHSSPGMHSSPGTSHDHQQEDLGF
jgi:hypothetical protein